MHPLQKLLHGLWLRALPRPLILPSSICLHPQHEWKVLDTNLAACMLCGQGHPCVSGHGGCRMALNDSGHGVCEITGYMVYPVSYSSLEYTENVVVPRPAWKKARASPGKASRPTYRRSRPAPTCCSERPLGRLVVQHPQSLDDAVHVYCLDLLVGRRWDESSRIEREKSHHRHRVALVKVLKSFKSLCPGVAPNLHNAACSMLHANRGNRGVRASSDEVSCFLEIIGKNRPQRGDLLTTVLSHSVEQERGSLAHWCAMAIIRHIHMLKRLRGNVMPDNKVHCMVVGLLYLMKNGVVWHGVVVLPKCLPLCQVLPMENFLDPIFKVRASPRAVCTAAVQHVTARWAGQEQVRHRDRERGQEHPPAGLQGGAPSVWGRLHRHEV